ncbi:TPA: DNA topoisomerase IV subunit B [Acinetobacter baumannii]|uniref:DNA topoisomerase IV subunit B n=1 Tax=Acinetobacter baumannii TaxID=470 RepID=UPI002255B950|nr:DNA topoisomerase IV subunit B [Acinetobacter baumannii]MCX3034193.1 DNA topoisomerase IV subunit B [Acinetobacter baumannii]
MTYTSESLEVLTGLDPVKKRPAMYTDTSRPNHLAQEVIDNSVDEALAGYASEITVILDVDGSISVEDNGRGMPVDIHPEYNQSGVEIILTKLHAGGKFSNDNYEFSGGLHGVGISVVNALSKRVEVTVLRNKMTHFVAFENGDVVAPLTSIKNNLPARSTGTTVKFWVDEKYFDTPKYSVRSLKHLLKAKAVLSAGLKITFIDKVNSEEVVWQYENGLLDYVVDATSANETLPVTPFYGEGALESSKCDFVFCWNIESADLIQESYVNLIPTALGGTHVNGLRTGITEAIRAYCELQNILPKNIRIAPEDVWDGINYVLSLKLQEAQFAGQTKERLSSREAAQIVSGIVKDAFSLWLHKNTESANTIAEFIISKAVKRSRASKKVERKKVIAGPALSGKLADCTSHELSSSELFLVEGDSAGGSAKQARDKNFQAILPLKGKILNTWEVSSDEVLASQEIHDIAIAIGLDPDSSDMSELRYGKVCILADADSDGLHIATLLCTLFVRHFKSLVENGHLYVAMPPLYRIDIGKEVSYALDDEELNSILKKHKGKSQPQITRFKGLGEMNPDQLRVTTLNPDTRRLIQLDLDDYSQTETLLDKLMAKKRSGDRRTWLENRGNLASF